MTNPGPRAKVGSNGRPGRSVIFCRDTLKIGIVPENLGQMVTLCQYLETEQVKAMDCE